MPNNAQSPSRIRATVVDNIFIFCICFVWKAIVINDKLCKLVKFPFYFLFCSATTEIKAERKKIKNNNFVAWTRVGFQHSLFSLPLVCVLYASISRSAAYGCWYVMTSDDWPTGRTECVRACEHVISVLKFSHVLYLSSVLNKLYFFSCAVLSFQQTVTRSRTGLMFFSSLCSLLCAYTESSLNERAGSPMNKITFPLSVVRHNDKHRTMIETTFFSVSPLFFYQFNEIKILQLFIFSVRPSDAAW